MVSLRGMNKSGYQTMNDDDEESGPPSITGVEESKDNDDDESGPPSMTSVEESKDNDDEGSGLPSMTSVDESKDNDDEESGLPSMTSLDESKGNDDEESGLPSTTSLDESKDNDDGDSIVEEEEDDDDDDDEEVIVEEYEDYTSDDGVLEEVSDAATPVDVETPKEIAQKAPSPPQEELPEQAPRMVRAPSIVQLDTKAVQEAKEDQCLSSLQGLVVIGILLFLAVAGIAIGTGLGVAKPFEEKNIPPTPTVSPSFTPAPSVFPTFAPVPLTLEDEELLSLWETVVGDVVYEEDTPYYEAAQWMLYRDPSRVTRRGYRRHLQSNNNTTTTTNTIEYTDEDLNYIQRYLLVFLYFATTNNGRRQWTSCNPVVPEYTEEDCVYSKAIRKLPSGEIQYEPIPWTRWLSGADECDWAGVTCTTNAQNRLVVSGIDLGGQALEGPMNYVVELMKLPEIKSLSFAFNQVFGALESALETLDLLDLTDNFLQGPLIRLGGLSSLTLEGNVFTGTVPTELFEFTTPLTHLNLGRNRLQGGIPPEASFALQLTSLHLHENLLEGTIPLELGQLPLRSLRLDSNTFVGTVPIDSVNVNWLNSLEELWLFNNQLTGEIPVLLGTATRMLDLRLSNNNLIGGIPTELYTLDRLFRIEVAGNRLSGGLDGSLASVFPKLEVLDLSGNEFSGPILFDSNFAPLQSVRLEFNQLTGNVPQGLCEITSLEVLTADCLPISDAPNPCSCCTACCSRSTGTCSGPDGSPLPAPTQPPTLPPNSSMVASVQRWAQETFGDQIDQSIGSPHSLTSIWIVSADSLGLAPDNATFTQRYVLALFYFTTRTWKSCNPAATTSCLYQSLVEGEDGSLTYQATPATRWLAPVSECQWVGVVCTEDIVTGIDLFGQEITGTLPAELATLSGLDTIKLAYNSLTGTIPSSYGEFTQLKNFQIQGNLLVGAVPSEVCQISSIESLQADCDEIECTCCTECCSNGECTLALRR